jgi:pyridoxal phosphate enzyme (YggS family)
MKSEQTSIQERLAAVRDEVPAHVTLVAVSKTKPQEAIEAAASIGQIEFGENRVQEMAEKATALKALNLKWHHIGHLQTNKVKQVVPHAHLIHAVDSERLLAEINKRSASIGKVSDVLLQIHIATEASKFGWSFSEFESFLQSQSWTDLAHVRIRGLMGMATFTDDHQQVRREFQSLKKAFDSATTLNKDWDTLSMGMSGDWKIGVDEGSTMVRIGSSIFGKR